MKLNSDVNSLGGAFEDYLSIDEDDSVKLIVVNDAGTQFDIVAIGYSPTASALVVKVEESSTGHRRGQSVRG
jgi:hypothetical protein